MRAGWWVYVVRAGWWVHAGWCTLPQVQFTYGHIAHITPPPMWAHALPPPMWALHFASLSCTVMMYGSHTSTAVWSTTCHTSAVWSTTRHTSAVCSTTCHMSAVRSTTCHMSTHVLYPLTSPMYTCALPADQPHAHVLYVTSPMHTCALPGLPADQPHAQHAMCQCGGAVHARSATCSIPPGWPSFLMHHCVCVYVCPRCGRACRPSACPTWAPQ